MDANYVVNVDCAVARGDEYLCIERAASEEHAAGQLAFPGGKLEDPPDGTDAIAATACREVREETGVEVRDVAYVTSGTFESDTGDPVLNVVTCGAYDGGEAHPREPEEVGAVHWLTPDELRARDPPGFLLGYVDSVEAVRRRT
jgi:8-oxo-dGTP diphosphatase